MGSSEGFRDDTDDIDPNCGVAYSDHCDRCGDCGCPGYDDCDAE